MKDIKIAVVGLGYVGLPLACLFASKYPVVGFDTNAKRVDRINQGHDDSDDLDPEKLHNALANGMKCTADPADIADCNVYIIAVPTPVDYHHNPILTPLKEASKTVGEILKPGDYVVYESTVYPGTTEEVCLPVLRRKSGLKYNKDFFIGYSPERINPGDKEHTVENIVKITSGSTPEAADFIDNLYSSVLKNGTYRAQSIQVAEAAKVLENTQRDVNIAFINEVSKILHTLGLNTNEVINAASSKWNFLRFTPGLVGGHCISVDPYYLIERSKLKGYTPTLISEARHINDTMGFYVSERVTSELNRRGIVVREASVLILGFTFKPNCRDIRNTKAEDVYRGLRSYTPYVTVYDPWVNPDDALEHYDIDVTASADDILDKKYDVIIQCVNHKEFDTMELHDLLNPKGFIFYVNEPKPHKKGSRTEIAM